MESRKILVLDLIGKRSGEFFDIRIFAEYDFSVKLINGFSKKIKIDIVIGQFCIILYDLRPLQINADFETALFEVCAYLSHAIGR